MAPPRAGPRLLAALALAGAVAPGSAPAEERIPVGAFKAITPLAVRPPLETLEASFRDVALYLIGAPDAESFGVSIRATVEPSYDLTGKEKTVLYLYARCDDEPPARSTGVLVATLEVGDLTAGRAARSIVTTGSVGSLVPLSSVACAKLAVLCKDCGEAPEPAPAYSIRRLDPVLDPAVRDLRVDAASLALVGEPGSKSFGVAFRGTVEPTVELTGEEKPVIRLYTGCDAADPPGAGATNVATLELGSLRRGTDAQRLTLTKDATAFVPMADVGCAVIDME